MLIVGLSLSLLISGCGPKKEASSQDAINVAENLETIKERADYLVAQAKAFYNSKRFQDALDSAQYVLSYLDKDSQEAKDLIQKAKDALITKAQSSFDEGKKRLEGLGK
jgi:hypothetical protein